MTKKYLFRLCAGLPALTSGKETLSMTHATSNPSSTTRKISPVRKQYILRLIFRCFALVLSVILLFVYPQAFRILEGNRFFTELSPFHLLWVLWMVDMLPQIIPMKNSVALGSQKVFARRFRPANQPVDPAVLKKHIQKANWGALKVLGLWLLLVGAIGALYFCRVIDAKWLLVFSVAFYVCDLICVLIWCPFRLIMGNRCCTTCRIFNWDHMMMFSPLVFVGGFFSISLVAMAILALLVWEISMLRYPERFSETTNAALRCAQCTDKLCTQYCQKRRK